MQSVHELLRLLATEKSNTSRFAALPSRAPAVRTPTAMARAATRERERCTAVASGRKGESRESYRGPPR